MISIHIKKCTECPFIFTEYDDCGIGSVSTNSCRFSIYLKRKNEIIPDGIDIPDWCALNSDDLHLQNNICP